MTRPTAGKLKELAERHELALALDDVDTSFSLSREDMQTIVWALRNAGSRFSCAARPWELRDPPQDCDWPVCGCDPQANKVMDALMERGLLPDGSGDPVNEINEAIARGDIMPGVTE